MKSYGIISRGRYAGQHYVVLEQSRFNRQWVVVRLDDGNRCAEREVRIADLEER